MVGSVVGKAAQTAEEPRYRRKNGFRNIFKLMTTD